MQTWLGRQESVSEYEEASHRQERGSMLRSSVIRLKNGYRADKPGIVEPKGRMYGRRRGILVVRKQLWQVIAPALYYWRNRCLPQNLHCSSPSVCTTFGELHIHVWTILNVVLQYRDNFLRKNSNDGLLVDFGSPEGRNQQVTGTTAKALRIWNSQQKLDSLSSC